LRIIAEAFPGVAYYHKEAGRPLAIIMSRVRSEEQMRKEKAFELEMMAASNMAPVDSRQCYLCRKIGHIARNCPNNHRPNGDGRYDSEEKTRSSWPAHPAAPPTGGQGVLKGNGHCPQKGPLGVTPAKCGQDSDMLKDLPVVTHSVSANTSSESKGPHYLSFWSNIPKDKVLIDSGATHAISPRRDMMFDFQPANITIQLASEGQSALASGTGGLFLELHSDKGTTSLKIPAPKVILSPLNRSTLLPTTLLQSLGINISFPANTNQCVLTSQDGTVLCVGYHRQGKLYEMPITLMAPSSSPKPEIHNVKISKADLQLAILHLRLGHLNARETKSLAKQGQAVKGIDQAKHGDHLFCVGCQLGKAEQLPFSQGPRDKVTHPGDRVHIDIWGPARVRGIKQERYMLELIDEATNHNMVYFMHSREGAYEKIKVYKTYMENQYGSRFI
jgi:hypothetical protein